MKCRRPNCRNTGQPTRYGLCSKHRRLELRQSGRPTGLVPVGPVFDHLSRLQRAGLSHRCIGKCSGVSAMNIYLILRGDRERVRAETAQRLLSVGTIDILRSDDGRPIPSTGTVRRLRALHAIGYTAAELAARLNASPRTVAGYLLGESPLVRAKRARGVAELFSALEMTPPPPSRGASRAINRARKLGWALPLRWDEHAIDDPAGRPIGTCLDADWFLEYEKLTARGHSREKIAALIGINPTSLNTRLRRLKVA